MCDIVDIKRIWENVHTFNMTESVIRKNTYEKCENVDIIGKMSRMFQSLKGVRKYV